MRRNSTPNPDFFFLCTVLKNVFKWGEYKSSGEQLGVYVFMPYLSIFKYRCGILIANKFGCTIVLPLVTLKRSSVLVKKMGFGVRYVSIWILCALLY